MPLRLHRQGHGLSRREQLRKTLGDRSGGGRMIRTLHRLGYAFIGDAIVAGNAAVAGGPVCRLIWRGESIDVSAGESVATVDARFKSMRTRSRAATLG